MTRNAPIRPASSIDSPIGWTLALGLAASLSVMVIGLVLAALQGTPQSNQVLPLEQVSNELVKGNPTAITDLGILCLMTTPSLGIVAALIALIRNGETIFVAVALALLCLLLIGIVVALR